MPYENVPETNAPPLPPRDDEYDILIDLQGTHPDGDPRSTVDDLELFSSDSKTSIRQMLNFLDRVVVKVELRGRQIFTRKVIKESYEEDGETKERDRVEELPEGVRGKKIPLDKLKMLMDTVGEAMNRMNNPKN